MRAWWHVPLIMAAVAAVALGMVMPAAFAEPDLDQNWNDHERTVWETSSQGSRLIPLSWFKALEQKGSTESFLSDANILKYRYLPRTPQSGNEQLPLGFVIDKQSDKNLSYTRLRWKAGQSDREEWVGLTCAACHTAQISFKSNVFRVEGGPTLADFQSFVDSLYGAVRETSEDPQKFARFASKVLDASDDEGNRALLRSALLKLVEHQNTLARLNATTIRYGFGRLDAVGHILNKVALISGAADPTPNTPDAPVSYPFLWNIPKQDLIQWNGMVKNDPLFGLTGDGLDIGALGRNTGEVIGVFGDVITRPNAGFGGFTSSVNVDNLSAFEGLLRTLKPPRWPAAVFGNPDPVLVAQGETLFKAKCMDCHTPHDRNDLDTRLDAKMVRLVSHDGHVPIGTDPWMACNAYMATSATGNLVGSNPLSGGEPLGDSAKVADMLGVTVKEVLIGKKGDVAENAAYGFFGIRPLPKPAQPQLSPLDRLSELLQEKLSIVSPKEMRKRECLRTDHELLAYKARSLNGIWATAPYLHNGSVPSLYQLLLPPNRRMKSFNVGSREFDPQEVGFVTSAVEGNSFVFDTTTEGNSNLGHDYGAAELSEQQRRALVEYMKTL